MRRKRVVGRGHTRTVASTSTDDKPEDIEQYKDWLRAVSDETVTIATRLHYEAQLDGACKQFTDSAFWSELANLLRAEHQRFELSHGYELLLDTSRDPVLKVKPFDSFLLKTFRKNIVSNERWPNPPLDGWLTPSNWISRINDPLRCLIVAKYIGGVTHLAAQLQALAGEHKIFDHIDLEAKEEGYYAVHIYLCREFNLPSRSWDAKPVRLSIEIQICTALAEHIRRLLHRYYEQQRSLVVPRELKWQWDYKSEEFGAHYLGHILHYVEGMLMELMERRSSQ